MRKPAADLLKETYEACPHSAVKAAFEPTYTHVCKKGTGGGSLNMDWSDINIRYGDSSIVGAASELLLASLLQKLDYEWRFITSPEMQKQGIDFEFKNPKWKNWYTISCKTATIGKFFDVDMHLEVAKAICKEKVDRFGLVDPYTRRAIIIEASKLIGILRHNSGITHSIQRIGFMEGLIDQHNSLDNGKVIKSRDVYDE